MSDKKNNHIIAAINLVAKSGSLEGTIKKLENGRFLITPSQPCLFTTLNMNPLEFKKFLTMENVSIIEPPDKFTNGSYTIIKK